MENYKANFLWPPKGDVEKAGYEFANGNTEEYRELWWRILLEAAVPKEFCICAAWKAKDGKVYNGHRHIDCLDTMGNAGTEPLSKGDMGQGFTTSTGRFVDRFEGYKLQIDAGIQSIAKGGYRGIRLFSEDLY